MKRWIILTTLLTLAALSLAFDGCPPGNPSAKEGPAPMPYSLNEVTNLSRFSLSADARDRLESLGFVVIPGHADTLAERYKDIRESGVPVFVTTDAMLHATHIFYDYLLRILETRTLNERVQDLTARMLELSDNQHEQATRPDVRRAAWLNIGFFAVARKLLDPTYTPPDALADLVDAEVKLILAHDGIHPRPLLKYETPPIPAYALEDYSQYTPRGHYTRNDTLRRYFRAMMWYGRMNFLLRPGTTDAAIQDGRRMSLQGLLMADALRHHPEVKTLWDQVYDTVTRFVGPADDLTVADYMRLLPQVFTPDVTLDGLGEPVPLDDFIQKALALPAPKILSHLTRTEDRAGAPGTRGMRFMGQRFIPDGYVFQQLVYHRRDGRDLLRYTGKEEPFTLAVIPGAGPVRGFPRGLDLLGVLGSDTALQVLAEEGDTRYTDYDDQVRQLRGEFDRLPPDQWTRSLYWRWLDALTPLLKSRTGAHVPRFMQSPVWQRKALVTALGSWTELRHDSILYAKQSYAVGATALPPEFQFTYGYVEPYPEVYARLEEMLRTLDTDLGPLGVLPDGVAPRIRAAADLAGRLKDLAEKELLDKPLSRDDYEFIWTIGTRLAAVENFPPNLMAEIGSETDRKMDLVADVHTEPNTRQVVEEAVGAPADILVIIRDRQGVRLCRGAMFSHFEFKQPLDHRLTDEEWQEMSRGRTPPPWAGWTREFVVDR